MEKGPLEAVSHIITRVLAGCLHLSLFSWSRRSWGAIPKVVRLTEVTHWASGAPGHTGDVMGPARPVGDTGRGRKDTRRPRWRGDQHPAGPWTVWGIVSPECQQLVRTGSGQPPSAPYQWLESMAWNGTQRCPAGGTSGQLVWGPHGGLQRLIHSTSSSGEERAPELSHCQMWVLALCW